MENLHVNQNQSRLLIVNYGYYYYYYPYIMSNNKMIVMYWLIVFILGKFE